MDRKYSVGQHGFKTHEQQRLDTSGDTFQSEHIFGLKAMNPNMTRNSNPHTREMEKLSPAYQEIKSLHRAHPGTGNSGLSDQYRQQQQSLTFGPEGISIGGQFNMVLYNDPTAMEGGLTFQSHQNEQEKRKSNNSLMSMVSHMPSLPTNVTDGGQVQFLQPTPEDIQELRVATIMRNMSPTMSTLDASRQSQRIANFDPNTSTTSYYQDDAIFKEHLDQHETAKIIRAHYKLFGGINTK